MTEAYRQAEGSLPRRCGGMEKEETIVAFEKLEFTKSWERAEDFPTHEASEAQVRADLQLLHNEARDGLNRLVDALNDPTAAAQMPFQAKGVTANNVQDAILEVYGAIQDTAAGQIVNGSVTKEKLAVELLERVYGGRPWVAMDTPGAAQTPETGFPVGQLWLRPAFAVENLAGDAWSAAAGTVETAENGWRLTGDGTLASASMGQSLTGLGTAGQQVFVSLRAAAADSQLTELTLYLNGVAYSLTAGGGVFESALNSQGGLEVTVTAQWPAAALAVGSVTLTHWAVVNAAQIEGQQEDCAPLTDWPALLAELVPFQRCRLGREVYMQTAPGQWARIDEEVLPVERGGTGLDAVSAGQLLYGAGDGNMAALDAPAAEGSVLCFADGRPGWQEKSALVQTLGVLRVMTGSYTGTGAARSITLPVEPILLFISSDDNEVITLAQNAKATETYTCTYTVRNPQTQAQTTVTTDYTSGVTLSGAALVSAKSSTRAEATEFYGNVSGQVYKWIAVY